ncbi:D-alanyl-D-alanine carboxypeptidase family protein [Camelliibacillus cellulosilyticus]|uniref:D-alanyl-D-alanine carboxypeptidase family protein n=1 Tax=Camelliibacillus cellulosilyticus TaxID=2174486 RepID=A0ABV9GL92_9BACL
MKKGSQILAVLCVTALLTACGNQSSSSHPHQSSNEENEQQHTKHENQHSPNQTETKGDHQTGQKKKANQNNSKSASGSNGIAVVANPTSVLVLVNKTHKLPDGYKPSPLVYPNVPFPYSDKIEKREMREDAAKALKELFDAAKQAGYKLYGESGYRSYERQVAIYNQNVKTQGEKKASMVSAHPGTSEHQTGLAIDITSQEMLDQGGDPLIEKFGETPSGKWVADNAYKYGFIIRYPKGKEAITGYEYEPWHIRYVGKKAAAYIYEHQLTLEQYVDEGKVNG